MGRAAERGYKNINVYTGTIIVGALNFATFLRLTCYLNKVYHHLSHKVGLDYLII